MPGLLAEHDGPLVKRQRLDRPVPSEKKRQASRIFAPYRTLGLVSPTAVPFVSVPLGKTTFQITTSTGRSLHTYDLRRGLNLLFITRPETPSEITATYAWKDRVFASYGGGVDAACGVWAFKRGKRIAELVVEQDANEPIKRLLIFGSWIVGCCSNRIHIWRATSYEHYTTLTWTPTAGAIADPFSGVISNMPTMLNKILVGKQGGSVDLWNVNTGKLIYTIAPPNLDTGAVTALQPAPALSMLAIARANGSIIIHDIRTNNEIITLNAPSSAGFGITSISFRTDDLGAGEEGRKAGVMATASADDGDVTLWDLNKGGRIMGVLRNAHNPPSSTVAGGITKVEFLPGQAVMITSGHDNSLKSWIFDAAPFSPVPRILHSRSGHAAPITCLSFLPARSDGADDMGKWVMSAGRDRSLWGWSLRRDGQSTEISQGNVRQKARKLGFSGKRLELDSSTSLENLKAPEITCMACCLNRDGGMGASTGGGPVWANVSKKTTDPDVPVTGWESLITGHKGDKFARTWFWGRKKAGRWAFETSDGTEVKSVATSPCGTFALIGSAGGSIDMFNLQSGMHRKKFPSPLTPAQAKKSMQGHADSSHEDASLKHAVQRFDPGQGKHTKDVTGIVVDNLNRTVISCALDGKVKFWDFSSGELRHEVDWHPMAAITGSRYHRTSDLLALSCDDLSLRVVDTETRKLVRELWGCVGQIKDFCFSNDGRWIVAASMDSVIRVWDLPTGHLINAMRLESTCTALAFSPAGEFLVTAHADNIGINVWTNRSLFTRVPTRHVLEDDIVEAKMPTPSGEGGHPLLAAAFEGSAPDDDEEEGDTIRTLTDQVSAEMITLSLVPRSRWQTLLHLDVIAARNKPIEPPKAPEKAPFFLPSLEGAKSTSLQPTITHTETFATTEADRSRISAIQRHALEQPFTALLHASVTSEHEPFISHLKSLPPAAADIEIRSLNPQASPNEFVAFIAVMSARLRQRRDYEVIQAWMAVFLRVHGEVAAQDEEVCNALADWRASQVEEAKRLRALVGFCGGVLSFLRSAR